MLELIFQGLIEWLYGLILEAWEYFFSVFVDILNVDFAYLKQHIPVIPEIMDIMLAVGWALLLGNLVFQATRSMMTGLGFEGEDPKQLFTRTFVFAFLLVASPQICEIGLSITSSVITLLDAVDAVDVQLIGEGSFGGLAAEWLLIIIINIILMFKVFRLLLEIVERYLVLALLTICAPLAFGMGGSKNTSDIFSGWCRMFASMCFVMVSNMIFFKLLLSLLGNVPTGVDVLLWIALVFGVVKVARKVDGIITRIGLNPAMTGDGLGGRGLPGMLAYTVVRSMASQVVKTAGNNAGSTQSSSGGGSGANANGGKPNFHGPAGGGAAGKGTASGKAGAGKRNNTSGQSSTNSSAQQNTATHTQAAQPGAAQGGGQRWTPAGQPVNVTPDDAEAAAMEGGAPITYANTQTQPSNARVSQERRSSVPPGTVRSPSHVKQSGGARVNSASTNNVKSSSTNSSRNTSVRSGQAMPGAASPVSGTQTNTGKNGGAGHGMAGTGGTSGMRTGLGGGKAPQPGLAGTGAGSGVRAAPGKADTPRPGTAGTDAAADARNSVGKGAMPQSGLAGSNGNVSARASSEKGSGSRPGTAGMGTPAGTRKTSVSGTSPRPGLAGTAAGSKGHAASGKGAGVKSGTAGNGTISGTAPGENRSAQPGTAGTGGAPSGHTTHNNGQAATRFTNAPRMAQNQTVQNSVQSAQQSAVTLEGAKQTSAGSAGKTPPPAAPGAGANAGGKDSRFTQRPATAQAAPSGTGPQPGTAGTAAGSQNPQTSQTARESQRTGGSVAPAGASAPGTARQESRISRQSGTNAGNKRDAPNMSGSGKRAAPSGASAQPKSRPGHPSVTGDSGKRAGSATARQESRATARNPSAAKGMASVQRPGMAGTAPPAARPSRKGQDKTRPPKPEETASDVKENTNGAETVPTESEKEDGGDE